MFSRSSFCLLAVFLFVCSGSLGQDANAAPRHKNAIDEYRAVLDAYFESARGTTESVIVVRTYPSFEPESEIVIQSEPTGYAVVQISAAKQVWGTAYNLTKAPLTAEEYISKALAIKAVKRKVPLSDQRINDFVGKLRQIDVSAPLQRRPLKNSKGQEVLMTDGTSYELILEGGRVRTWVTDTSDSDTVSENPPLLDWIVELETAVKRAQQIPQR